MQRLNLNNLLNKFSARTPQVVAAVTDYAMLTPTLARVIVAVNTQEAAPEQLAMAISAAFGNDASAVEGSFRKIESMGTPALYGFVKANTIVKPYEVNASAKNMQALSSNMFIDNNDSSLWQVQSAPDGTKMLARQSGEDLSELMATARVHQHNQPVLASVAQDIAVREYAAFVDPTSNEMRFGYVLATDGDMVTVMPNDKGMDANEGDNQRGGENSVADRVATEVEPVTVQTAFIVETAYLEKADADRFEGADVKMPADSRSNAAMQTYYKELYAYDPSYYAMIQKQINEHASL